MHSFTLLLLAGASLLATALAVGQYYVPRAYYTIDDRGHESAPVPLRRLRRSLHTGPLFAAAPAHFPARATANANANANARVEATRVPAQTRAPARRAAATSAGTPEAAPVSTQLATTMATVPYIPATNTTDSGCAEKNSWKNNEGGFSSTELKYF